MTLCSPDTLACWMEELRGREAAYIRYRLASAFELIPHTVNHVFLAHMQSRWNAETRTFHLGERQFCPTVEEFRGILRLPKAKPLTLCPIDSAPSLTTLLQQEFGFTLTTAKSIIRDGKLDLQRWSCLVQIDTPMQGANPLATTTVLLDHHFLAPADRRPSAQVFKVAHTLRDKTYDISGLILAETIMGLNASSLRLSVPMRGSPLTLYVWLLENLSYIPPHHTDMLLGAPEQHQRLMESTEEIFVPETRPLRDTMPWYGIQKMLHQMDSIPQITLFGLEHSVSYFTLHLHRQFGRSSMPEYEKVPVPYDGKITKKLHHYYNQRWDDATDLDILEPRRGLDAYFADVTGDEKRARAKPNMEQPVVPTSSQQQKRKPALESTSTAPKGKKKKQT